MKKRNITVLIALILVTFANTLYYWSIKPIWFFINKELGSFLGIDQFWAQFFWTLLLVMCLYIVVLVLLKPKKLLVHAIINGALNIIFLVLNIYLYGRLGSETGIITRRIASIVPLLVLLMCAIIFVFYFPTLKITKKFAVRLILAVLVIALIFISCSNIGAIRITSGPLVQYLDDDTFAVIWTTNNNSVGWVEYGSDKKTLATSTTSEHGIITANTTHHKVLIDTPTSGDMYFRVGSQKIRDYFQNNVVYGDTVYSHFIKYNDSIDNNDISFYVLSDIHVRIEVYEKYLGKDDYDFVVLNGDILSSVDSEALIVDSFLAPLSSATDGFRPFYFARGNHETRGASARALPNYLALPNNKYYYTFSYGPVFAIVLDTAEDKLDDHEEYSGLADFERYKEEQTKWLEDIKNSQEYKDAKYKIAFSHIPLNTYYDDEKYPSFAEIEKDWVELLNHIDIDALFSGHTHRSEVIERNDKHNDFPIIIGGGYKKAHSGYEALKVIVNNAEIRIEFVDEDGDVVNEFRLDKCIN